MIHRTLGLAPPDDYEEISSDADLFAGLTNCGFTVHEGIEHRLRTEKVWTRYAGWNFNGRVWYQPESFLCQVWVHHRPVATVHADTIDELMHEVSAEWGYD